MTPFNFGPDDRRLFAIHSPRPAGAAPKTGVLLCNAFGREAIRAHRLYRVLADRLSRSGCDVLRFDYFGTGDSDGDDLDADLDGWSADVHAAHSELVRRAEVTKVVWLGMRIGAAVAAEAAQRAPARLARLILWDPILDGRDYLDLLNLRQRQSEGLTEVAGKRFRTHSDYYIDAAIGFPLSRRLCDQVRALRFAVPAASGFETHVICDPNTAEGAGVAQACRQSGAHLELAEVAHGTDWTDDRDASGLVPAPVINVLTERAGAK